MSEPWKPWMERWAGELGGDSPYAHPFVECCRREWWGARPDNDAPAEFTTNPRDLGELFNVAGLWWRPAPPPVEAKRREEG